MIKIEGEQDIYINTGFLPSEGGGGVVPPENYNQLKGKPQINGITLAGDLSSTDLKIIASGITNTIADFQILTGTNIQDSLTQIDSKLAFNEDYDSILLSLDLLNDLIGGSTDLPLSSLQTQLIDGRPSHKAPGAMVYDEFGTIGILDHIEGQTAYVTTVTTGAKPVPKVIENYYIEKNPLDGEYYIPVGSGQIKNDIIQEKLVRLLFDDVITNTGEQVYSFETFDKNNYAIFRRNIVTENKVERINIKVDYRGKVEFVSIPYKGLLTTGGTMTGTIKFQDNIKIETGNNKDGYPYTLQGDTDGKLTFNDEQLNTLVKDATPNIHVLSDNIYKAGEIASLTLTLPEITDKYISQVEFTSGAKATIFSAPGYIKWIGDDTESGTLVPAINSRYLIMFYSDGEFMRAISQKVGL